MIAPIDQIGGREKSLGGIEALCGVYDSESAKLGEMIDALERDLEAVKKTHLAALKRQAGVVARREAELNSAIESAPGLFVKPRTLTLHGVKVGLTYSEGKLVFDNGETVVKLIRKFRKDDAALFIRTKEEPNKDALWTLQRDELAKLGCRIEGTGDCVVLKRVAGDVEKLMDKLIEKMVEAMVSED